MRTKEMVVGILLPAALIGAVLILLVIYERSEIGERSYSGYSDLAASGEPGNWIPNFIPRDAVEIRAKYKIDTSAKLLTFYFNSVQDIALAGSCEKGLANEGDLPIAEFIEVSWWPNSLYRGQMKKAELAQYEFYRCEYQTFLALKRMAGRYQAFYWRN